MWNCIDDYNYIYVIVVQIIVYVCDFAYVHVCILRSCFFNIYNANESLQCARPWRNITWNTLNYCNSYSVSKIWIYLEVVSNDHLYVIKKYCLCFLWYIVVLYVCMLAFLQLHEMNKIYYISCYCLIYFMHTYVTFSYR